MTVPFRENLRTSPDPVQRGDDDGEMTTRVLRPTLRPTFRPGKIYLKVREPAERSPVLRVTVLLIPLDGEAIDDSAVYRSPRNRNKPALSGTLRPKSPVPGGLGLSSMLGRGDDLAPVRLARNGCPAQLENQTN